LLSGTKEQLKEVQNEMLAYKSSSFGFTGLIETGLVPSIEGLTVEKPSLEDIMIYYAKKEDEKNV